MRLENIGQNVLVDPSKIRCFSFVYKKMKRKRLEIEYTLVDEYLKQREKETLKKLRAIKEPAPKKPLLPKVNVTISDRKSNSLLCGRNVRGN